MKNQDIKTLIEETQSESPKMRKAALLQLCPCHVRNNVEVVWDRILEMSQDVDAGVRSIVLHNLCDGSPNSRQDEVIQAVEQLANDADLKIRRRARRALAVYRRTGIINTE